MSRIVVTGGTGYLGRHIVAQLLETGQTVRIMSQKGRPATLQPGSEWAQAQMETGSGLAEAVEGCDVIVHAASDPQRAQQVDVAGTRLLLEAARKAGVAHIVYISIVGIDRIPFAYYRHKLVVEEMIQNSGIPWSILRATQFHEFIDLILQGVTKIPFVALIPTDFKVQSVAASEVARRLCGLVAAGPTGRAPDYGGPEILTSGEMARSWFLWRGIRRVIVPLWIPGNFGNSMRHGENTCPNEPLHGQITWARWMQERQNERMIGDRSHANVR